MAIRQHTCRSGSSRGASTTCRLSGSTRENHGSGTVQVVEITCTALLGSSAMTEVALARTASGPSGRAAARSGADAVARKPTRAAAERARRSSGQISGPGPTEAAGLVGTSAGSSTRTSTGALSSAAPSASSPGSSRTGVATCERSHSSRSRSLASDRFSGPRRTAWRTRSANGSSNEDNGSYTLR